MVLEVSDLVQEAKNCQVLTFKTMVGESYRIKKIRQQEKKKQKQKLKAEELDDNGSTF